jgi:uncharacterized RDD family membrane protein YckC
MEKIGFGPRLVAYIIDLIILLVINFVIGLVLGLVLGDSGSLLASLLSIVIAFGYLIYFWTTTGQTPGKKMMGLKVIATDGATLNVSKAVMRIIGYMVSGAILYLGFIWILFDTNKQGWHDKIAGTYVVKA